MKPVRQMSGECAANEAGHDETCAASSAHHLIAISSKLNEPSGAT
ncbi:hypothetical protein OKW48_003628 [Paraburkholderia youngii]